MQTSVKLGIGISLIVGVLIWLVASGFQEGKTYYYTVDEVAGGRVTAPDSRLKISGEVVAGTIARRGEDLHFRLEENGQQLPVVYVGTDPVPDTFKDHAKAVVEGRLQSDGSFRADKIQAKCASKYEAMYDEMASEPNPAGSAEGAAPLDPPPATGAPTEGAAP